MFREDLKKGAYNPPVFVATAAAFGGGTVAAGVGVGMSCVEEVLVAS